MNSSSTHTNPSPSQVSHRPLATLKEKRPASYLRALAWRVVLDPLFGGLNYILVNILHVMDKAPSWLGDPSTALASVITVNVWSGAATG